MKTKLVHFQTYLEEEVKKVRGRYYPVRSSFLRQAFVRRTWCTNLHPNPEDEFCNPKIGPNYDIVARYEEDYKRDRFAPTAVEYHESVVLVALIVEKAKPDGYLILNGHHRWAAAFRTGVDRLNIHVVNLTHKKDIQDMLRRGRSDKRVTLDLDEVVFCGKEDPYHEKPLSFPLSRIYKERVRVGIPALFHFLTRRGYDIWVYTSEYYSVDYIRTFFKHMGVRLTGIVTGTGRKSSEWSEHGEELKKQIATKYAATLHIDGSMVLRTFSGTGECAEYPLSGSPETWSREVMDAVQAIEG